MTPQPAAPAAPIAVYVAGNATIHAGRRIGAYASGAPRYAKMCASNGRARYEPTPCGPDAVITCKRCLAKIAARDAERAEDAPAPTVREQVREMYPHGIGHGYVAPADRPALPTADDIRIDALRVELATILGYDDPAAAQFTHVGFVDDSDSDPWLLGAELFRETGSTGSSVYAVGYEGHTATTVDRLTYGPDPIDGGPQRIYDRDAIYAAAAAFRAVAGAHGGEVRRRALTILAGATGGPYAMIADAIDVAVTRDGHLSPVSLGTVAQSRIAAGVAAQIDAAMIRGTFAPVIDAIEERVARRQRLAVDVYGKDPREVIGVAPLEVEERRARIAADAAAIVALGVSPAEVVAALVEDLDAVDPDDVRPACGSCDDTGTVTEREMLGDGPITHTYPCDCAAGTPDDAPECDGHPAGPHDPMGTTVYCDGSCQTPNA
jgi:hypothetical protein